MNCCVAIVDDDKSLTELLTEYFKGRGYKASGYMTYCSARREINSDVDLVIIDIHLSDGNGHLLMSELCKKYPEQKHIIITTYDSLAIRLKSFSQGADDYMKKPIFPSELEARVRRLLSVEKPKTEGQCIDSRIYTTLEQELFSLLKKAHGEVVPLRTIEHQLHISEVSVYTSISRLRKRLPCTYRIKAAYGRGWYLEVEVPSQ